MRIKIITATACALMLAAASLANAASTGSSSSSAPAAPAVTKTSPKALHCKKNQVIKTVIRYGKKKKVCRTLKAGLLDDSELYNQGEALARQGEYDWALTVLAHIKNQDDPRVLNYTGYSHRKAGRLETGITYYRKALAINPDFVLAREYLGEGYVAAGRVDLAKVELAEIAKRCGISCTEYQDLNKAIQTAAN
jgi:tetratricopeptide (TPR) repeat protein